MSASCTGWMPVSFSIGSVQRGAEFKDAGAGALHRRGERQFRSFVEQKDDAVELAFAGSPSKREANGMEQLAAADCELGFEVVDDLLEAVGGDGTAFEKEEREFAEDFAGAIA